LQDVALVYRLTDAGEEMSVTGHVEQLHQSKCYQKSESLTCTTCHDPHGFPRPEQRVPYYRTACLGCHAEAACKVDPRKRQQKSPDNSCIHCHMPTGPTDVPHARISATTE
jgi:predicted CXXCH cytochrome family protein